MIIFVYGFKDLVITVTFKFEMFTNDNAINISLIGPFACFCTLWLKTLSPPSCTCILSIINLPPKDMQEAKCTVNKAIQDYHW